MLPVPTVAELATFTDREADTYSDFAVEALTQSTLLFSITTRLSAYPDDDDMEQLARNAILQMAERIYLERPYVTTQYSPFQSETIGSYSYAKGATFLKAREGGPTGLFWWDLAIDELSDIDQSMVSSGAVTVMENDYLYVDGEGRRHILGPGDLAGAEHYGLDVNAELNPRPRL